MMEDGYLLVDPRRRPVGVVGPARRCAWGPSGAVGLSRPGNNKDPEEVSGPPRVVA